MKKIFLVLILLFAMGCSSEKTFTVPDTFKAWNTYPNCASSRCADVRADWWDTIEAGTEMIVLRKLVLDRDYLYTTTLGYATVSAYEISPKKRGYYKSYYVPAEYVDKILKKD